MMDMERSASLSFLICRSNRRLCALPLHYVAETMRPLPLQQLPDLPAFLLGLSIIRGWAVPVVDLARLISITSNAEPKRYITFRIDQRLIAFAVDAVVGIYTLAPPTQEEIPPLLREADTDLIAAIRTLDADLLLILRDARMIPDSVWQVIDAQERLS